MIAEEEKTFLTLDEFTQFMREQQKQPLWRSNANRERDYSHGNQLETERLEALKARGILPIIDNQLRQMMEAVTGMEVKNRTDYRVMPESNSQEDQDVADALNLKLNQAEKLSRADRCISDAYEQQVGIGLGWVYVERSNNPFEPRYKCQNIDFNDVFFDWFSVDPMLRDSRWLMRKKWVSIEKAKQEYPEYADQLNAAYTDIKGYGFAMNYDEGVNGMRRSLDIPFSWDLNRDEWINTERQYIRLYECWYRRWVTAWCVRLPSGRVVELDKRNPEHLFLEPFEAQTSRVYMSVWAGYVKVFDEISPYAHGYFPYVPFWGYKEERSKVPYGKFRNCISLQDMINVYHSKIEWALSSTRTVRTAGVVLSDDEDFRNEVSGLDADIVLSAEEMAQPGAKFELVPNTSLMPVHMQALETAKRSLRDVFGISNEYQGVGSLSKSNAQEVTRIQQSSQAMANIDDNKNESRTHLGELLLSMIIQDIGKEEVQITIPGDILNDQRIITVNQRFFDGSGVELINNDLQRVLLKVNLTEVPTTQSYRQQQFVSFSEVFKSSPPQYQQILLPYWFNLSDLGEDRQKIIDAIKQIDNKPDPEMEKVKAEIELKNKEFELKLKELELKAKAEERSALLTDAQIKQITATVVKTLNEAQFSAYQVGAQVMMNPSIAPVADVIMDNSGYQLPNPEGVYPGLQNQMPLNTGQPVNPQAVPPVQQNTHPQFPANVNIPNEPDPALQTPETLETGTGQAGLQTMRNEQIPPQPEL